MIQQRDSILGRVCDVLEFLADHRVGVTKFQIAEHCGCHPRSAHRVLLGLQARGFAEADRETRGTPVWKWRAGEKLKQILGRAA